MLFLFWCLIQQKDSSDFCTKCRSTVRKGIVKSVHNNTLYTPGAHYNVAQWTRDFAYLLRYAPDLVNKDDVKYAVELVFQIEYPDRITMNEDPIYSPGDTPLAPRCLDNFFFSVSLLASYVDLTGDTTVCQTYETAIKNGYHNVIRSDTLVYNPHGVDCTYGFADQYRMRGHVLFITALWVDSKRQIGKSCGYDLLDDNEETDITNALYVYLYDKESGFYLSSEDGIPDVWGSLYLVQLGLVPGIEQSIVDTFMSSRLMVGGLVRQYTRYWSSENCFDYTTCPMADRYQNGGYWVTPLAWIIPVIRQYGYFNESNVILEKTKQTLLTHNFPEWIGFFSTSEGYVVSCTNVYHLLC